MNDMTRTEEFERDNCWHCATEEDPCPVAQPDGAEICEEFVGVDDGLWMEIDDG